MRLFHSLAATALAGAAIIAGPASAANILFSQNFDALPVGVPAAGVPGFTVTGTVDVVQSGTFSIDCVGGSGKCLDIDGTPGPGALKSNSINFIAGKKLTISFDLSGNQRNTTSDNFKFGFEFDSLTDMLGFGCTSGFTVCGSGDLLGFLSTSDYNESVAGTRDWLTYSLSFMPNRDGSLQLRFGSTSADFIGPVIDNVLVSQVPEPESWALLIAGFGLVGAAQRRRKAALSA